MSGTPFHELISLAGHGLYVWGSLALCIAAVLIEWTTLRRSRSAALRRVRRLHASNTGKPKQ